MKTVVFVDELLLVNFAAAAALLLGAGLLCGRSCTGLRLCVGRSPQDDQRAGKSRSLRHGI